MKGNFNIHRLFRKKMRSGIASSRERDRKKLSRHESGRNNKGPGHACEDRRCQHHALEFRRPGCSTINVRSVSAQFDKGIQRYPAAAIDHEGQRHGSPGQMEIGPAIRNGKLDHRRHHQQTQSGVTGEKAKN